MFINFYSKSGNFDKDDKTIFLIGYSDYINKYFHMKIKKCQNRNLIIDIHSDEQHLIVKSSRTFYCLSTEFFDKFIEPTSCLNFRYDKYDIPVNVYIAMMGLLTVKL